MKNGGINNEQQNEIIAIVAELANQYVSGDSTSVSYERAQALMEGVLYCLNACEGAAEYGHCLQANRTVREMYHLGRQIVWDKTCALREKYNQLMTYFDDYGMICLRDTVVLGVREFLRRYDARFAPQETLLTLDYPVMMDISELSGVDAVFAYMECITCEQQLLRQFDSCYIRTILRRYHPDYEHLYENICYIVLLNLLGHMMLGKPLSDQGFTEEEMQRAGNSIMAQTEEETETYIAEHICMFIKKYYGGEQSLQEHLLANSHALAVRVRFAASVGHLEKIFLV